MPKQEIDLEGILEIGKTRIPYKLRRSERAVRQRIVVEPGSVEVVIPKSTRAAEGHRYVQKKRRWVFDKIEGFKARTERIRSYRSGSKVRFRGRWLTLEVRAGRGERGWVTYRSRFWVTIPRGTRKEDRTLAARKLLDSWMNGRLLVDAKHDARRYGEALGVDVARIEITRMKRMWASCGKNRIIRFNPDLIELPRVILEYVVAHEVCHLIHRNHSPAFWREVGGVMPDWRERQAWLKEYEGDWEL